MSSGFLGLGGTWQADLNLSMQLAMLGDVQQCAFDVNGLAPLIDIAASFQVDVIEVIGHTDERALSGGLSNLDRELPAATSGARGVGVLQPADNAGLGLARALAVVKVLASEPGLRNFRILPLSGAQLIGTDGRLTRWDEHLGEPSKSLAMP